MRILTNGYTLAALAVDELEDRVSAGESFTAYNITTAVRHRQPHIEIPHAAVRAIVHRYMSNLLATGHYRATTRMFGMQAAILYTPHDAQAQPDGSGKHGVLGVPGVPLLPMK